MSTGISLAAGQNGLIRRVFASRQDYLEQEILPMLGEHAGDYDLEGFQRESVHEENGEFAVYGDKVSTWAGLNRHHYLCSDGLEDEFGRDESSELRAFAVQRWKGGADEVDDFEAVAKLRFDVADLLGVEKEALERLPAGARECLGDYVQGHAPRTFVPPFTGEAIDVEVHVRRREEPYTAATAERAVSPQAHLALSRFGADRSAATAGHVVEHLDRNVFLDAALLRRTHDDPLITGFADHALLQHRRGQVPTDGEAAALIRVWGSPQLCGLARRGYVDRSVVQAYTEPQPEDSPDMAGAMAAIAAWSVSQPAVSEQLAGPGW